MGFLAEKSLFLASCLKMLVLDVMVNGTSYSKYY